MKRLLGAVLLVLLATPAGRPVRAESIFAREALGRWVEGYDLRADGMGGVAVAVRDSFPHSQLNPAALAFAMRTSGYFSLYPESRWVRGPEDGSGCPEGADCSGGTAYQMAGRLGGLHAIIALGREWRAAFGIRQTNDPSYVIENRVNAGEDDAAKREEEGTGGFLEYSLAAAWRPLPRLGVGIEGILVSGAITDIVRYDFESTTFIDTRDELRTRIKNGVGVRVGAVWGMGGVSLGAFYSSAVDEDNGRRSWRNANGFVANETIELSMPAGAGWGASVDIGKRWRVGGDAVWRRWSNATFTARDGSRITLDDTWRFGLGVERVGNMSRQARFGDGLSMRLGVSYDPWYFEDARGHRVREIAASAGLGLPISRDRGTVDLLFRLGKRSIQETDRPNELFLLMGLGVRYASMPRGF